MVNKSENLKKSQKISKNLFKKSTRIQKSQKIQKISYPLSFPILGGRNPSRALQTTSFQNPGGGYHERYGGRRTDGNPCVEFRIYIIPNWRYFINSSLRISESLQQWGYFILTFYHHYHATLCTPTLKMG